LFSIVGGHVAVSLHSFGPVFNESQLYKKLAILAAYLLIAISGAGCCSFDGWLLVKR
jgi:uncharacterized membrane protein YphA (DoxX/SURF4 family)